MITAIETRRCEPGTDFDIVKAKGGFYVFQGLSEVWEVCMPTRRAAERWIDVTMQARAEAFADAARAQMIADAEKAERAAKIAAARAAAPVQLEMFA